MQLETYNLTIDYNSQTFEFWSEGPKGKILKLIQFQKTALPNFFNLAFGDVDDKTGEIDDRVVTNNGDSEKVLATVAAAMYTFTELFSDTWIYAKGSTIARTRLYQMGINKYYGLASSDFEIMGQLKRNWEVYEKGKNYEAFVVRRKKD